MSHKSLFASCAITLGLLSLSTGSAYADYMTGFEPPTYSLGLLAGQDGWSTFGPAVVTVENFNVDTGSQAVFVDGGSTATGQSGPYHTDTAGSVVDLSADIYLASSSTETEWQFAALGAGLVGYAGGINIQAGTNEIDLISTTRTDIGTFVRNQWNQVDLLLNYTTQTYSVSINGTTLASNVAFCGNNIGPCTGAVVAAYADGIFDTLGGVAGSNDAGFLDNYSVATVATPEPGSIFLLCSLVLALTSKRLLSARAKA